MRTPRAFVPASEHALLAPGAEVDLPAAEAFHLTRVLRRAEGDRVILVPAWGGILAGEITRALEDAAGPRVRVKVLGPAPEEPPAIVPWTVALAVVKSDGFDLAVRMAAELGLARIAPVWTERTVVRPERPSRERERRSRAPERPSLKLERWARIAREAAKQCGRAEPLRVEEPQPLAGFLAGCTAARRWIAVPSGPLRLEALLDPGGGAPGAAFLVGPEGGFTAREVELAAASGFEPLGFPTPVLRTPTAVALIAALGLVASAGRG